MSNNRHAPSLTTAARRKLVAQATDWAVRAYARCADDADKAIVMDVLVERIAEIDLVK